MGQSESKNDEQESSVNFITTDSSYTSFGNDFQSELQQRRRLAEEKYKTDSALYLAQCASKYDTDEYVDECVTEIKKAALQSADKNESGFSIVLYRFMGDFQFHNVSPVRELEKKIIGRIVDKFCSESGFKNTQDMNIFNRGFAYTIYDRSIMYRGYF